MYGSELAKYYDLMRQYRNYSLECRFADTLIKMHLPNANRVLDICCGTGEHATRMAQLGYQVTGIDQSQEMLDIARDKAKNLDLSIKFECADINEFDIIEEFQVAYCFGYTFLYMTTYSEVMKFFQTIWNSLVPNGLFMVDFINGFSLIEEFDKDEFVYQHENATIKQKDKWYLDKKRRIKHMDFEYEISDAQGNINRISAEEDLRIWFDDEVQYLLSGCYFNNVESYGDYTSIIRESDNPKIIIVKGQKGVSKKT